MRVRTFTAANLENRICKGLERETRLLFDIGFGASLPF